MKRLEIGNSAQFLFELRYPADMMVSFNKQLLDSLKSAGFSFPAKAPDDHGA